MGSRNDIICANPNCGAKCGRSVTAIAGDPGYIEVFNGAVVDDQKGEVFCSQECSQECHPAYCAECGDERVGSVGDRCTYCSIVAEQGEDAAYAWYRAQHPELLRKPVASVPSTAASSIARKNVG